MSGEGLGDGAGLGRGEEEEGGEGEGGGDGDGEGDVLGPTRGAGEGEGGGDLLHKKEYTPSFRNMLPLAPFRKQPACRIPMQAEQLSFRQADIQSSSLSVAWLQDFRLSWLLPQQSPALQSGCLRQLQAVPRFLNNGTTDDSVRFIKRSVIHRREPPTSRRQSRMTNSSNKHLRIRLEQTKFRWRNRTLQHYL